jgi:non-homologous end joining protein Ku
MKASPKMIELMQTKREKKQKKVETRLSSDEEENDLMDMLKISIKEEIGCKKPEREYKEENLEEIQID